MPTARRAGIVAGACIAAAVLAQAAASAGFGPAAGARIAPLTAVDRLDAAPLGPRPPAAAGLALEVAVLNAAVQLEAAQRPRFPVRGPFNWGQEAAAFGSSRGARAHAGQDVMSRTGTPLVAVSDGVVLDAGQDSGRGYWLAIYDRRLRRTYVYLHMDTPARVGRGRRVRAGERVGSVGCSGSCDGPHVHFEIRAGRGMEGRPSDPRPPLERWAARDGVPATLPPGSG